MTDALVLVLAVAAPWLAGAMVVHALLAREGERDGWVAFGYGHFAGVLAVTLLMRAFDLAGARMSFLAITAALLAIAASAGWLAHRSRPADADRPAQQPHEARLLRYLAAIALVLIALRIGVLAAEVLVRPLLPWDAWSQWATKAKVWSALRDLVPFIGYDAWLAREPGYTDTAPHYPATIPLLQTWMALALGRWDDTLVNLPWLAAFAALGAGVFGQLRRLGLDKAAAAIATYLVLSLPMLDVHVALAGYADLHLGAAFALGVLALAQYETTRSRAALALLGCAAILLPLLKVPGIAWLGVLGLGAALAAFGTTLPRILGAAAVVLGLTVAAALALSWGKVAGMASGEQAQIAASLVTQLFAFGSWNLLWYVVPLVLAFAWRTVADYRATAATLACGFAFLAWTFFFTRAGDWVVDYTTVNRALLHIAPAVAAFVALVVVRHDSRVSRAAPGVAAASADRATTAPG